MTGQTAGAYVDDKVLRVAGTWLPAGCRRRLARYRYGPGVFKVDWALSAPIPWTARACERAGTMDVGGASAEIATASAAAWDGRLPRAPFVLVAQPTRFDDRPCRAAGTSRGRTAACRTARAPA